jgi:hypothetical protein
VCCAGEWCVRPKGLTATVLCMDCHDDFHHNTCGGVVDVYDRQRRQRIARNICSSCYNLCSAGRDMCIKPGKEEGRVLCIVCQRMFHADGCGYSQVTIDNGELKRTNRCKACVDLSKLVYPTSGFWKHRKDEFEEIYQNKIV